MKRSLFVAFALVVFSSSCSKDPETNNQSSNPTIIGDWDFQQTEYRTIVGGVDQLDSVNTISEHDTIHFGSDGWFYQLHRQYDNDTVPYMVSNDTLYLLDAVDSIPYFAGYITLTSTELRIEYYHDTIGNGVIWRWEDLFFRVP